MEDSPPGGLAKLDRRQHVRKILLSIPCLIDHSLPKCPGTVRKWMFIFLTPYHWLPWPARWHSFCFILKGTEDVENLWWLLAGEGSKQCLAAKGTIKRPRSKRKGFTWEWTLLFLITVFAKASIIPCWKEQGWGVWAAAGCWSHVLTDNPGTAAV